MRIHVLVPSFSRLRPTPGHWLPYFFSKHHLKELGIKIRFFRGETGDLTNCDALVLSSQRLAPLNSIGHDAESRSLTLEKLEKWGKATRIIWSDESDSTGTTQFDVLPFVSAYWKKQLLKDRDLYLKNFTSGRIHFDYWSKVFGFKDTTGYVLAEDWGKAAEGNKNDKGDSASYQVPTPLIPGQESKLHASWTLALHDWRRGSNIRKIGYQISDYYQSFTRRGFKPPFFKPYSSRRGTDVSAMLGAIDNRICGQSRRKALSILAQMNLSSVASNTRLPIDQYIRSLCDSKINLGIFGLGEICYREFETFCSGAALVMPDMSHIECYPDIYLGNVTYAPIKWDYSDMNDVINSLLENEEMRLSIAKCGQESYMNCWSDAGMHAFATRFDKLIGNSLQ